MPRAMVRCLLTFALTATLAASAAAQRRAVYRQIVTPDAPTRVAPPARVVPPAPPQSLDAAGAQSGVSGDPHAAAPSSAMDRSDTTGRSDAAAGRRFLSRPPRRVEQRVTVRHLYDTPDSLRLRADLDTFYQPHGTRPTVDPGSAAWALEGAYLARDEYDRRQLLRLYNFRSARERQGRLRTRHELAVWEGVDALRRGDYAAATAALTLAAELDHADPACRIHLAQARLARGQYELAAAALRRGLELQPKLIYVDLDLDGYYASPGTLRRATEALGGWLRRNRASADAYFMLGYLRWQLGDEREAASALRRVAAARPRDTLTRAVLTLAEPGP